MFHPLLDDAKQIKDIDLENKILDLTKKYHIAARLGQGAVCQQILLILEMYKSEQYTRNKKSLENTVKKENQGLDDLINVD